MYDLHNQKRKKSSFPASQAWTSRLLLNQPASHHRFYAHRPPHLPPPASSPSAFLSIALFSSAAYPCPWQVDGTQLAREEVGGDE
jgi:hypothetical protein